MWQNVTKFIQKLLLGILILLISSSCFASMKLYISDDCQSCDEVLEKGKEAIQQLEDKDELKVVDVTDMEIDLPALPALVDDKKVIIGTGLLEYLAEKAQIEISLDNEQMLTVDE